MGSLQHFSLVYSGHLFHQLGEEKFALDAGLVREIIDPIPATKVAGAKGWMMKPFKAELLVATVRKLTAP